MNAKLFTVFGRKFKFQGQNSDLEYFFGRFDKPIALSEKKAAFTTISSPEKR